MAEHVQNFVQTTLNMAAGVSATATTITVADASVFTVSPDFRIAIDAEIMLVTGVSGDDLTVTRAPEGPAATVHMDGAVVVSSLTAGALEQYVSENGGVGSMTNPMTTAGDLIVGGSSGTPTRLAKGTDGQVLKMASGAVGWGTDDTAGFANPMTTAGDLIVGGSAGAAGRLAKGTDGQVLKMVAGAVAWGTDATGGGSGGSVITLPLDLWRDINGTAGVTRTSTRTEQWFYRTTAAVNDEWAQGFMVPAAGSYKFRCFANHNDANRGIVTFYVDGTSVGTQDFASFEPTGGFVDIDLGAVAEGWHVLSMVVTSKSGGSSAYIFTMGPSVIYQYA